MMPPMTADLVHDFLDEPGHLLRIGTVDDSGQPLVVPIWFARSGSRLLFTPRARSQWFGHLRTNPKAGCTIDESQGLMRKVVARGRVRVVHDVGHDDEWRDTYRDITMRYVPAEFGERYLSDTRDEPRALVALDLEDADVSTWRMPGQGEDSLAVWAPKYYHDGRTP
jgi:nitroimidazol reductase NimA-like FMN-containing flavoprotein (pyridoxamine 5'-phosphate oxidase superfamily)